MNGRIEDSESLNVNKCGRRDDPSEHYPGRDRRVPGCGVGDRRLGNRAPMTVVKADWKPFRATYVLLDFVPAHKLPPNLPQGVSFHEVATPRRKPSQTSIVIVQKTGDHVSARVALIRQKATPGQLLSQLPEPNR